MISFTPCLFVISARNPRSDDPAQPPDALFGDHGIYTDLKDRGLLRAALRVRCASVRAKGLQPGAVRHVRGLGIEAVFQEVGAQRIAPRRLFVNG